LKKKNSETFDSLADPQTFPTAELREKFHTDGRRRLQFPDAWKRKDMAGKVAASIQQQ
jgi:hypothetical protein